MLLCLSRFRARGSGVSLFPRIPSVDMSLLESYNSLALMSSYFSLFSFKKATARNANLSAASLKRRQLAQQENIMRHRLLLPQLGPIPLHTLHIRRQSNAIIMQRLQSAHLDPKRRLARKGMIHRRQYGLEGSIASGCMLARPNAGVPWYVVRHGIRDAL